MHLHIKKVQVLVPLCFHHNNSSSIVDLTTILVKFHFETFRNEFTHEDEIVLHFWNMKNLGDGYMWQFASHLHCGFMFPLPMASKTVSKPMNTFLGEMRSYVVNHYCLNVMCCIALESTIQSYVVWSLALNVTTNIFSWSSQAWLAFFFSSLFFFKQFLTKWLGFLQ